MTASSSRSASGPSAAAPAAPAVVRGGAPDPDAVESAPTQQQQQQQQQRARASTQPSSRRPSEATTQATQTFRLAPSVEDGIKAAVAGAATTPARQRHLQKWTVIKYFLRWASLVLCVGVIIGETFESIMNGAYFGTIFGIIWTTLIGGWNVWRIDRLRKRGGVEDISTIHLIAEGSIVFSGLVSVIGLGWATSSMDWDFRARAIFLVVAIIVILGAHGLLFFRAYVDEKHSTANAIELSRVSASPQQQPAQIIVQYVQVCPHCSHQEPMTGESLNEAIASRGELQPQNIRPEDIISHPH